MEASDRIFKLIKEHQTTPAAISRLLHISKSNFTTWKNRPTSNIGGDIITKLAAYFNVSCDYLLLGKESDLLKNSQRAVSKLAKYDSLIDAYQKADKKSRNLARAALDLPPEK